MKQKIVTHFYVKDAKKDRNGEAPIYLRLIVNNERAEISYYRKINPELWDKMLIRMKMGQSIDAGLLKLLLIFGAIVVLLILLRVYLPMQRGEHYNDGNKIWIKASDRGLFFY